MSTEVFNGSENQVYGFWVFISHILLDNDNISGYDAAAHLWV
jgi:hypothetical protein